MDTHSQELPRFDRPPLVETSLGVQFAPIVNFTSAHYGWFWKQCLNPTWTTAQDAPRLVNQFEKFSEQALWQFPGPPLVFHGSQPDRIMFINDRNDRVIQIQNDRFYYNWRKGAGAYPTFAEIYPEFRNHLRTFEGFLRDSGLESPAQNQWELAYFNSIPKGDLWNSPSEWPDIVPGLFGRIDQAPASLLLEAVSGAWRFEISPGRGRIYIAAQLARIEHAQEVLQVHLTARGPVIPGNDELDLEHGMAIGHESLVRTFAAIASPTALAHWGAR